MNEIRQGLHPKPFPKPEPLIRYEQAQSLSIPYRAGGLEDQPYLWMQEHGLILAFLKEQEMIDEANQQANLKKLFQGATNANPAKPIY